MANNTNPSEVTFAQKTSVIIDNQPKCYAIQKSDWDYLKSLINNCSETLSWIEIITSAILSIGISFVISLYTTETSPEWFGYLGYSCCMGGILGIIACILLRKTNKSQISQVKGYFKHIEEHLPNQLS